MKKIDTENQDFKYAIVYVHKMSRGGSEVRTPTEHIQ